VISVIASFRISGHFLSFRLLGFHGILCGSVFQNLGSSSAVPLFRLLEFGVIFRRSAITYFRIWGHFPAFRDSAVLPFCRCAVLSFQLLGLPIITAAQCMGFDVFIAIVKGKLFGKNCFLATFFKPFF